MPKALSKQEFLNQKNRGYNNINTPIGGITINLEHAWEHMNKKNTFFSAMVMPLESVFLQDVIPATKCRSYKPIKSYKKI